MNLRYLAGIILLWLGLGFSPVASALHAANPDLVSISVDTKPLVAGQTFRFTIRLHDNGLAVPEARMPPLDPRITLLDGPEITTDTVNDETGRQGRFVFMRYTAKANSAGYAALPAITVQYGVQSLVTRPVLLAVTRAESSFVPPDLVWHVHTGHVYKGQTVFISLELVHCPTIVFPDMVQIPALSGGSFEELKDSGRIESAILAGQTFQNIPLTGFMFTPGASGTLTLPLARVMLDTQPIQTQAQTIQVSDLPPDAAGVSAIGDLKLSCTLESKRIGRQGNTRLSIRLEGTGNLKTLQLPVPEVVGFSLGERLENSKLVATDSGYRGYREAVYQIAAPDPGSYQIYLPPVPLLGFDGRVKLLTAPPLVLVVSSDLAAVAKGQTDGPLPMLGLDRLAAWNQAATPPDPARWVELVQKGLDAYAARDYAGSYDALVQALRQTPRNAGLLYDLGLASLIRGSPAEAVFHLQRAARLAPEEAQFFKVLSEHESAAGLKRQLPIVSLPGFTWLLIALVAGIALLVITIVAALVRKKPVWWVGTLAAFILLVASVSCLAIGRWQAGQVVGVVAETGAILKRIPETHARDWLRLASGTTLWTVGRSGDFILVETAFGIKGWVDHSALYLPESGIGP